MDQIPRSPRHRAPHAPLQIAFNFPLDHVLPTARESMPSDVKETPTILQAG